MAAVMDYWISSGYGLTPPDADGRLIVSDDLLRAYMARPELAPIAESCDAERALHASLMSDPQRIVPGSEISAIADEDAQFNFNTFLAFRDLLVSEGHLAAVYTRLAQGVDFPVPPLFMDQIAHSLMRHILGDEISPMQARAAELFFRSQRVTINEGQILVADEETVERYATTGGFGDLGKLLVESQTAMRQIDLDILDEASGNDYWARSDRFDMVLDLTFARAGLDAFCRVLEKWILYFTQVETRIHPVQSIRDERWTWHIGLDAQANALLNRLYGGEEVPDEDLSRLLSLFRMEIKTQDTVIDRVKSKPIYLGLAMDPAGNLRMKPQNLLVNMPLNRAS